MSAKEASRWRAILDYFSSATQIDMTATPKETNDVSNMNYFGQSVYIYSLKQGIEDGFLVPYKVIRVGLDKDLEGWRPLKGQVDDFGNMIEDREYNVKDFDRNLVLDRRTAVVAKRITEYLKSTNRMDKTIIFCADEDHAARMRLAIANENPDMMKQNPDYVVRITGTDDYGKRKLEDFIDKNVQYPVVVTTSQLLSTGVNCKTVKLIVLDKNIGSMTEFKQIIGRGTRIVEDKNKLFFTIMDFREASKLFADPDFDGDPVQIINKGAGDSLALPTDREPTNREPDEDSKPHIKYRIGDVDVKIVNERVQYMDENGKLIQASLVDYTKGNLLRQYAKLDDFIARWNTDEKKQAIIDELAENGILLEELRKTVSKPGIDDFDLICHIVFDKPPLTKRERVENVKKRDYFTKYEGLARDVLCALLDKYADTDIYNIEDAAVKY